MDTFKLGIQTATISFEDKTTTYQINVTNNGAEVGSSNANDLFISEYVEGSSNNKYIEIFNGTGVQVDLSDYKLLLFSNGASVPASNTDDALNGILDNGATVVYKNSSAALTLTSGVTATAHPATNFNGDDAIALYKISTSSYVDIFGVIGTDPGTAWTGTDATTVDRTLVRKASISHGVMSNPSELDPSIEWDLYGMDEAHIYC